jgi:hypothetical protein
VFPVLLCAAPFVALMVIRIFLTSLSVIYQAEFVQPVDDLSRRGHFTQILQTPPSLDKCGFP